MDKIEELYFLNDIFNDFIGRMQKKYKKNKI